MNPWLSDALAAASGLVPARTGHELGKTDLFQSKMS